MEGFDLNQAEKTHLFLHALKSSGANTEISALCCALSRIIAMKLML